jgi:DHA1 family putative efflux transporter-like MFS transporter
MFPMIDWRVAILVAGTFSVGLAELSLIGLLSEMAQDLGRPMADMGLVVSAYSISFALGPPIILHFCLGVGTRWIALGSLFGVAVGCFLASQAETLWALASIRAATAASGGIFVAVAVTMAVNLASPSRHGFVIGAILMGFSGALVLGVPLGMAMAASHGWRSVFILISAVCMAITMLLLPYRKFPASGISEGGAS